MPKENEKQRLFSRRAVLFGGLQGVALTSLLGRLIYLQFMRADEYSTLSENNRIKLQLMAPDRGDILDCHGIKMALNQQNYQLFIDPNGLSQKTFRESIEKLHALVTLPEKTMKAVEKAKVTGIFQPILLKENLKWEEVSVVELNLLSMPGISIDSGQVRHYPFGPDAAHLIGYVGAVSQDDIDPSQPVMRLPDYKIGKTGVEKMLEERLKGAAAIHQLEVNVHGVAVREVGRTDSVAGEDVKITIDSRLQEFASDLVREQSAGVVVLEVATGNVLALISMPGYDPDSFSTGITNDEWKKLGSDKKSPLLNKAIAGQFPPGSIFKMMVGLAGLESGVITPSSTVFCPGYFQLGNHTFNCWKEGGHGTVDYAQALQHSCDTFFYTVGQRVGPEKYAAMARNFGYGHVHELGLPGEKQGIMPDPDWKQKTYKQKWTGGDTINCAIGQGYVLATPLQLAVMVARIASGNAVEPRLMVPPGKENPEFEMLDVDEDALDLTREGMAMVVNDPGGTAYASHIADPNYAFAGKTGTSQVRKILQRGVNQNSIPWEYRHHAHFVAFSPVDNPKYAIAVTIEHGGGGAAAAAPVAKDILLKLQEIEGVIPTPEPNAEKPGG